MKKQVILYAFFCYAMSVGEALAGSLAYYVSGRAAFVHLQNTALNTVVFNGGGQLFPNTVEDGRLSHHSWGMHIAGGGSIQLASYPFDIRTELEYTLNGRMKEEGSTRVNAFTQDLALRWREKTRTHAIMLNGYVDFKTKPRLVPYIGGGLGYARIQVKADGVLEKLMLPGGSYQDIPTVGSDHRSHFAWNLQAGLSWWFNDHFAAEVGYRYAHLGYVKSFNADETTYTSAKYKIATHELAVGLRYTF